MKNKIYMLCTLSVLFAASCRRQNNPSPPGEENELITTVRLQFTDSLTGNVSLFSWRQPGGPGTAISADTIVLAANKTYRATVKILDESKSPAFDVTAEIKAACNEHRFFYTSTTTRISTTITDRDSLNPPMELGLQFTASTSLNGQATGTYRVLLKHYTAASPKTAGASAGSSDIDVSFPIRVD
jgi:hypothetical protein